MKPSNRNLVMTPKLNQDTDISAIDRSLSQKLSHLEKLISIHGELLMHSSYEVMTKIEQGVGGCAGNTMFFAPGYKYVGDLLIDRAYGDLPHVHICAKVGGVTTGDCTHLDEKDKRRLRGVLKQSAEELLYAGYRLVDDGLCRHDIDDDDDGSDDDDADVSYDEIVYPEAGILESIGEGWLEQELQARSAVREGYAFVRGWDDQGEVVFTCTNGDHVDSLNETFMNIDDLRAAHEAFDGSDGVDIIIRVGDLESAIITIVNHDTDLEMADILQIAREYEHLGDQPEVEVFDDFVGSLRAGGTGARPVVMISVKS